MPDFLCLILLIIPDISGYTIAEENLTQEVLMYTYPLRHWIAFFYIYCFFGWIFESAYVSLKKKRFVNRGFLRLPMLPLYGTGAVMMLWVSLPVKDHLLLVYLSGVVAATALEYITGYVMERLFKMRYWDYSDQKFQINGYICLTSSIAWGFLTIFLTEVIHEPVAGFVLALNPGAESDLLLVVSGFFLADVVRSTKEALALGQVLESMTAMKADLDELQVQLALLKAEASCRMEGMKDNVRVHAETFRGDIRLKAAELKQEAAADMIRLREEAAARMEQEAREASQALAERIRLLTDQYRRLLEKRQKLSSSISAWHRGLLRGNPSASSRRFSQALKELREMLEQR